MRTALSAVDCSFPQHLAVIQAETGAENVKIADLTILRFRRIDKVPTGAVYRDEKKVIFIEIECGTCWELEAEELFQLPGGRVVAVLRRDTKVISDEGLPVIALGPGVWLRD